MNICSLSIITDNMSDNIYLHVKNESQYFILEFNKYKNMYLYIENDEMTKLFPKQLERLLIIKQIIYLAVDNNTILYKLLKIDVKYVDGNINIFACDSPDKLSDAHILEFYDPMDSVSTISIDEKSVFSEFISKSKDKEVIPTEEDKSTKLSTPTKTTSKMTFYSVADTEDKSSVSSTDGYKDTSSSRTYVSNLTRPSSSFSTPTKVSVPISDRSHSINSTNIDSPEDYIDRSINIKKVKKTFRFTEVSDESYVRVSNTIRLFANQEGKDVHVNEENSYKINAFKTYRLIKKVNREKIEQTKFMIKGLFNINKSMLSDRTGTLIISNITLDEFMEHISSSLILL